MGTVNAQLALRPHRTARLAGGAVALVAFFLAAATASASAAQPSPIAIQVSAGYSGSSPAQGWIPVEITVTNSGPDVRGTLVVTQANTSSNSYGNGNAFITLPNGVRAAIPVPAFPKGVPLPISSPGAAPITQRQAAVLPSGTTKRFEVTMPGGLSGIQAQVQGPTGKTLATAQTSLTSIYGNTIAVVSDAASTLNQFSATGNGSIPVGPYTNSVQVVHLTPATLPDSAQVLSGFQLVVIDNATTSSFTAAQKAGLQAYVQQGGCLLVTGGDAWQKTAAGLPANLVLLAATGTQPLTGLPGLAATLGANALTSTSPVDVTVGQRRAGIADLADGATPILLQAPLGAGQLFYATPDLAADPLASWSGTNILLRQILTRATGAATQNGLSSPGAVASTIQSQDSQLYNALANIPSLDLPSPALIAILLVVFILLVGPANYVVLHRLHRPDAAWVTIPLLVALSGASIYGFGLVTRGTNVLADRIRVVYIPPSSQPGPTFAYVNATTGVFSPHTGNHQVSAGSGAVPDPTSGSPITTVGAFSFVGQGSNQSHALTIDAGPPASVQLNWPVADSIQTFGQTYDQQLTGGLEQHVTVTGGRLEGTVTNRLPVTITDAVVISGNAYHTFGSIRPGQSVTVDLPLPFNATPTSTANSLPDQIYLHAPATCGSQFGCGPVQPQGSTRPSVQQREAQRREQVLNGILQQNQTDVSQPLFVAWSSAAEGAGGPVVVDGKTAQLNELDAYVAPLQPQVGGTTLPAGVVPATAVDNNGPGPGLFLPLKGGLLIQGGAVTEQFALPGAAWTSLSLTMAPIVTPVAGMFPPGTAPAAVSVFNLATGHWDPVSISPGQTVALPVTGHVSADGVVLVKLTPSTNGLSLNADIEISGQKAAA